MFVPTLLDTCLRRKLGNIYVISTRYKVTLGPHWPGVLVTVALILGGSSLNLQVVDSKWLPGSAPNGWMRSIVYCFCAATLFLLFKTACTDPGIVLPTATNKHPHFELSTVEDAGDADGGSSSSSRDEPLVFCDICEIYSPERANVHHCHDCAVCLEGLDHHW